MFIVMNNMQINEKRTTETNENKTPLFLTIATL